MQSGRLHFTRWTLVEWMHWKFFLFELPRELIYHSWWQSSLQIEKRISGERQHMKRECVRREIVKQSHFVERKVSLCASVIIFVTIEWDTWVCRVTHYETEWTKIQRRVVSTIRLAIALEIKHNVLKETTSKALWEKLENIYASKSLTNHLCLQMELYKFKMEMRGDLHDHINKFNRLVSQLLNTDDKLSDEKQSLLLLASLPRFFKALVQTLLVGRSTLNLDEVTVALRENEIMIRTENVDNEHNAIVVVESE